MLPFSRMLEYGNEVIYKDWYTGNELMAFDSLIVNPNGFTDYTGKNLLSSNVSKNNSTDLPFEGTGFKINSGWLRYVVNTFIGTRFTTSWTLDYWLKNEIYYADGNTLSYQNFYFATTISGDYFNRLGISFSSGNDSNKCTVWNNSQSPVAYQANGTNEVFRDTIWMHVALVYDDVLKRINLYKNGSIVDYVSINISACSGNLYCGPYGESTNYIFERYRLREGKIWENNFNVQEIY